MAYSSSTDLLIGDTRLDGVIDKTAAVQAAADEIDSAIGFRYVTPVVVPDNPASRPVSLLLKTINNYLASGRILLVISRSGEDKTTDALGRYYVGLAMDRLKQIVNGTIDLEGVTLINNATSNQTKPTIYNAEPESLVDMFYGNFNPSNPEFWSPVPPAPRPGVTF